MKKIIIIATLLLTSLFFACDEINPPYTEDGGTMDIDTNKKNVLIEYYTGAKCGNCPPAAIVGKQLEKLYAGKVIMIGNHVGSFSFPEAPGEKYEYNFRSPVGLEIDEFYGVGLIGTPMGIINRAKFQNDIMLSYSKWEAAVKAQLEKTAECTIDLAVDFNDTTRTISLGATINYFKKSTKQYKFSAFIVEDGIVKYQKWYGNNPDDIPDYVHHNTLRSSMNGAWGENIELFSEAAGGKININLQYQIPTDSDWVDENLKIVAFVYEENDTREILNVSTAEVETK